jgi:hypothetical protein
MDRNKLPLDPSHIGVPSGASSLWYVWHKPFTYLVSRLTLSPNGLTSPSSSIRGTQEDFLACGTFDTNCAPIFRQINTFSKRTQMCFHLIHITEEFDWVQPKWSLSLLHIQRKLCTYLALRITLSPKWFSSLSYIQCKNHAPILHRD